LTVQDDGRGLALGKIYDMAVEKGIYEKAAAKPLDAEIANLVFASGFSTSDEVTDVSGRGVGMDAVKGFLEKEGGSIEVLLTDGQEGESFRGFSTNIRIPQAFFKLAIDLSKNAA